MAVWLSPNYVDTMVCFVFVGFACKITLLYGNPHEYAKTTFWHSMYSHFVSQSNLWLYARDFNEILWSLEKWGGAAPHKWRLKLFHQFLNNAQLRDLHFQGPDYTCFAMNHGKVSLKERLERALGNAAWCSNQSNT